MTPACTTITLSEFQQAITARDVQFHLSTPRYARRELLAAAADHCPLCRQPFNRAAPRSFAAPIIATCVHTFLGGPLTVENAFVCCRRCQQSRSSADLLTIPELPATLQEQRARALLLSQNHLVPLPLTATLADYRNALAQRHAMPRSRVYAAQADDGTCLLGVSSRYGDGQSKGLAHLLARWAGTPLASDKRMTVYQMKDEDFRRVAWQLVDANAWLVGVGRRTQPRDFIDHWWLTSASVGELRLRKVAGVRVPPPQLEVKSVSASAIRMRRMKERRMASHERAMAEGEYQDAKASMEAMMSARRRSTGFPTDHDEMIAVLFRYGQACRKLNAAQGY